MSLSVFVYLCPAARLGSHCPLQYIYPFKPRVSSFCFSKFVFGDGGRHLPNQRLVYIAYSFLNLESRFKSFSSDHSFRRFHSGTSINIQRFRVSAKRGFRDSDKHETQQRQMCTRYFKGKRADVLARLPRCYGSLKLRHRENVAPKSCQIKNTFYNIPVDSSMREGDDPTGLHLRL